MIFTSWSEGIPLSTIWQYLFFWGGISTIPTFGLQTGIRRSICVSKSQRSLIHFIRIYIIIIIIVVVVIIYSLRDFLIRFSRWFFHWSLSDSKSPQVSRTLLSILTVLNNAVAWRVSICPPTSKSSSPFSYLLLLSLLSLFTL